MSEQRTKYKYIHFKPTDNPKIWQCFNNKSGGFLGTIFFYGRWHTFSFEPEAHCVFDAQCLTDIIDFMKQLKD